MKYRTREALRVVTMVLVWAGLALVSTTIVLGFYYQPIDSVLTVVALWLLSVVAQKTYELRDAIRERRKYEATVRNLPPWGN